MKERGGGRQSGKARRTHDFQGEETVCKNGEEIEVEWRALTSCDGLRGAFTGFKSLQSPGGPLVQFVILENYFSRPWAPSQ